jgi:Xaa-Pro dipeptidase
MPDACVNQYRTLCGIAEQGVPMTVMTPDRTIGSTPVFRLRAWLAESGWDAVVLSRPSNVGWLTSGANTPIDRAASSDSTWLVVTPTALGIVTTNVETDRVSAEFDVFDSEPFDIVPVPWHLADFPAAVIGYLGVDPVRIASDTTELGTLVSDDLTSLRMQLDATEQSRIIALGRAATVALEAALAAWTPGMTDYAVQAQLIASLEADGIQAPIVIVGGDDRVERFRHPLAIGAPMYRRVMAVVVARRHGLHVAVTRYADAEPHSPALAAAIDSVRGIESALLARIVPGATYGQALEHLATAYADAGHPGAWTEHYQGGPIGFDQREFEIGPANTDNRWFHHQIQLGHAVAFNPSLSGGAKVEDTYLVTRLGLVRITDSAADPSLSSPPFENKN